MFLCVKDNSNQIKDYSGLSVDAFKAVLYLIYMEKLSTKIKKELNNSYYEEYFQLKK